MTRDSRFSSALDASIPMLVVSRDNAITQANAAAHRLLGYPHGALRGLYVEQLAPESERAALVLMRAARENATHLRIRSRVLRADGRVLDVSMSIEPCLHDSDDTADLFISYKALAPWEAQSIDEDDAELDEDDAELPDSERPLEELSS